MAGQGFKVADAYADFHVDVDKGMDEAAARIKARGADFDRMGKSAGGNYGREFAKEVSSKATSGQPIKIKVSADTALAQSKIVELTTRRNAAVLALDADVSKAEAKIKALQAQRGSTKLDVDAEVGKAEARIKALQAKRARILLEVDVDKEKQALAEREVDRATERVAQRAQNKFKALQFAGAFAGLPVAAAAGAAGVGAALGGVPLLFAGIAAAALRNNEQIAASFTRLKTSVVNDVTAMAAPMAGPLAGAADALGASFTRLKPQIQAAMTGSVPAVGLLTGAVTNFAENAMPGLLVAVKNSVPPLEGFKSVAGQVGAGFTDMWTNMAAGSQGAKAGLIQFGGVTRDLLGFAGNLFTEFANGSASVLPQFRAAVGQAEGTVLSLAHNGMPAMQGATSGFLGVTGGLISAIGGVAQGLGSWAQPLGSMAGSLFATNSVARIFGTSLGETGFGLRAFGTSLDESGNKTTPFKSAIAGAEGVGGKFKAGLNSVVNSGVNPLGIALVAGGFILDAFGKSQQQASEQAAAHRENVRSLTDAIRQDNGVIGQNVQSYNAKILTDKNASANLAAFGQTMGMATAAIGGNTQAYGALQTSASSTLVTIAKSAGASDEQAAAFGGLAKTSLETGKNYGQLDTEAKALLTTSTDMGDATVILDEAQRKQVDAIINGTGAVGEQIRAQREAVDAYQLAESAVTGLTTAQVAARDATSEHTKAIYEQQNAQLGYRGAVLNTQDAMTKYTDTMNNGKASQQDKLKATLDLERAFAAQEQAVYNAAFASSKASSDQGKQADATRAMNAETVNLANTFKGALPQSMVETISKFDATMAAAAGLKTGVNNLGEAVYILPNGKQIVISGETKQARDAINALPALADATKGTVVIGANTDPATGKTKAAVQYADGSRGVIAIDGNRDPATGKTMVAVQYANGQRSFMSIDALNQAALDKTLVAKRNADGTVAWIIVGADTAAANAAIDWAARKRTASLTIQTSFSGPGAGMMTGPSRAVATGGLVTREGVQHRGYADGGLVQRYAAGGMTDVTAGGLLSGPGGPRGDKISALVSDKEFVVNATSTARNLAALIYANRGGTVVPAPRGAAGATLSAGSSTAPAPQAAPTINHYNTFNVQEVDVYTLATRVSRELSLRSRTGASM